MKEGIHLGPRKRRPLIGAAALLAAGAVTAVLSALYYRANREVFSLEAEIARLQGVETRALPEASEAEEGTRIAELRLSAAMSAGAPGAILPSDVLRLVASTIPEDMTLVSFTVTSPPRQSLLIEAVARGPSAVTSLQERVKASPLVSATRLLEERRLSGGELAVRFEVALVETRTP